MPTTPALAPTEARVLAVLVEKERITPDVYPLTLNALTAGCNQKTSRDPVLQLDENEVRAALETLRQRDLVQETYGASGRVLRYAQNFAKVYGLPAASVALLSVLALRGPQTVNELRANCERLYRFDDASSVEAYLEELAARGAGALACRLPRQPGSREQRWAQLLCGATEALADVRTSTAPPETTAVAGLETRVAHLEAAVDALRQELHDALARLAGTNKLPS